MDTTFEQKKKEALNLAGEISQGFKDSNFSQKDIKGFSGGIDTLTNTINTSILKPQKQIDVTKPKTNIEAAGMAGVIDENTRQYAEKQQKADTLAQQQSTLNQSRDEYKKLLESATGEVAMTDTAYKSTVDPIQEELNKSNQDILVEKQSLIRKLEALDKNPQGLLGDALQNEKSRVERESLSKQADLSIIQQGIQGRYDSAKSIADRAVMVKLEDQKNKLEAYKFTYDENKDIFTKEEQRAFETSYKERERALNKEEQNLKDISDLSLIALENGAPSSVVLGMRGAKSIDDAIIAGAQYLRKKEKATNFTNEDYRSILRGAYPEIASEAISKLSEKELEDFVLTMANAEKNGGLLKADFKKEDPIRAMQDLTNYGGQPRITGMSVSKQNPQDFLKEYMTKIGKNTGNSLVDKINAAFGG